MPHTRNRVEDVLLAMYEATIDNAKPVTVSPYPTITCMYWWEYVCIIYYNIYIVTNWPSRNICMYIPILNVNSLSTYIYHTKNTCTQKGKERCQAAIHHTKILKKHRNVYVDRMGSEESKGLCTNSTLAGSGWKKWSGGVWMCNSCHVSHVLEMKMPE
jgi:hypothetical protein